MTLDQKGACNMMYYKSFCKKQNKTKNILTGADRSIQAKEYYAIVHLFAYMRLDLTLFPNKTMFPLKYIVIFFILRFTVKYIKRTCLFQ